MRESHGAWFNNMVQNWQNLKLDWPIKLQWVQENTDVSSEIFCCLVRFDFFSHIFAVISAVFDTWVKMTIGASPENPDVCHIIYFVVLSLDMLCPHICWWLYVSDAPPASSWFWIESLNLSKFHFPSLRKLKVLDTSWTSCRSLSLCYLLIVFQLFKFWNALLYIL